MMYKMMSSMKAAADASVKCIAFALLASCGVCGVQAGTLSVFVPPHAIKEGTAIANMPLLVRLSEGVGGFSYAACQSDGSDLWFTASDGSVLPHEIDTWNTAGESLIWVRVPRFARGESYTLHFGESAVAPASAASDVWSGYACVLHCREDNGSLKDSSGHGNDAQVKGANASAAARVDAGAVGSARKGGSLAEGQDIYHHIPNVDTLPKQKPFSFSGWFRAESPSGYGRWVSAKTAWDDAAGWELTSNPENEGVLTVVGGGKETSDVPVPSTVGVWTYLAVSFTDEDACVYANGRLSAKVPIVAGNGAAAGIALGNNAAGMENRFNGQFDEFRYREGTLSAAEAEAAYRMVVEKNFLTYSVRDPRQMQAQFEKSIRFHVNIPATAAFEGSIAVPVRLSSSSIAGFSYEDFHDDAGLDSAFFDDAGNLLEHEVDEWNPSGESIMWVRLPSLAVSSSFTLMYGSSTYQADHGAAVWSDYAGVWHLGEESGTAYDATAHGLDAVVKGGDDAVKQNMGTAGVVGTGRANGGFGSSPNDEAHRAWLAVADTDALNLGDTFTLSGWFKTPRFGEGFGKDLYAVLVSKRAAEGTGWGVKFHNDQNSLELFGASGYDQIGLEGLYGGWAYLTVAYAAHTATVYINGEEVGTVSLHAPASNSAADLAFGCLPNGGDQSYPGVFDEIRIRSGTTSAGEVQANWQVMARRESIVASAVCDRSTSQMPTLSVVRVQDGAVSGETPVVFRVALSSPSVRELYVPYTLSGSAQPAVDYELPRETTVCIPAGASSADVEIRPLPNQELEASSTLAIRLEEDPSYALAAESRTAEARIVQSSRPRARDYCHSVRFTISSSFIAEGEALRDFPVLVRLSEQRIPGIDMNELDPERLTFCDCASGKVLPYEIDEWRKGREMLVWVIVPELKAGYSFILHYARRPNAPSACAVRPWNGYAGVWHFNESTASIAVRDATAHALHAQPAVADGSTCTDGVVGTARMSNSDEGHAFLIPSTDDIPLGSTFSFSCWVRGTEGASTHWRRLLGRKTTWNACNGLEVELSEDGTSAVVRGGSGTSLSVAIPDLSKRWNHLVLSISRNRDDATLTAYVNGEKVTTGTIGIPFENHLPWVLGGAFSGTESDPTAGDKFVGCFDEVRLRAQAVGDAWVRAMYNTVADENFLQAGDVRNNGRGLIITVR